MPLTAKELTRASGANESPIGAVELDLGQARSAAAGTAEVFNVQASKYIYNAPIPGSTGVYVSVDYTASESEMPSKFYLPPGAAREVPFRRITVENNAAPGRRARLEFSAEVDLRESSAVDLLASVGGSNPLPVFDAGADGIAAGFHTPQNALDYFYHDAGVNADYKRVDDNVVYAGSASFIAGELHRTPRTRALIVGVPNQNDWEINSKYVTADLNLFLAFAAPEIAVDYAKFCINFRAAQWEVTSTQGSDQETIITPLDFDGANSAFFDNAAAGGVFCASSAKFRPFAFFSPKYRNALSGVSLRVFYDIVGISSTDSANVSVEENVSYDTYVREVV